jgi:hypothetical protein
MKRKSVFGLGRDASWLETLESVENDEIFVRTMFCRDDYLRCLENLLPLEPNALLLIDSTGQSDLVDAVRKARQMGWQNVVVVAAAPNWREAYRTIRDGGAIDYWTERRSIVCLRQEILDILKSACTNSSAKGNHESSPVTCRQLR